MIKRNRKRSSSLTICQKYLAKLSRLWHFQWRPPWPSGLSPDSLMWLVRTFHALVPVYLFNFIICYFPASLFLSYFPTNLCAPTTNSTSQMETHPWFQQLGTRYSFSEFQSSTLFMHFSSWGSVCLKCHYLLLVNLPFKTPSRKLGGSVPWQCSSHSPAPQSTYHTGLNWLLDLHELSEGTTTVSLLCPCSTRDR